ncbi:MAG: ABC transporter permease [Clostridia bacterium]|nr:ABC transporter permease [Clostridia bacterium]
MVKYIIKRLLLAVLILFSVSVIMYILVRNIDLNALWDIAGAGNLASGQDAEEKFQAVAEAYGYGDNSFLGIIKGYFSWLGNFLQGDMGTSITYKQPVEDVISKNMGISFTISLVSLILQLIIAIPLGIKCAVNQYGKLDYVATFLTMIGISFPTFFAASLAIRVFSVEFGWFPVSGIQSGNLISPTWWEEFKDKVWHMTLPIIVLVVLSIGSWSRYTRTNTLEVLNADYIRTARAKGLSERSVVYKHVFRNSLIPLVTVLAGTLPTLFGGAMITETMFSIPGIGKLAYDAMIDGDIPFIMGYNMFLAMLTVIGILLTDIMYAVVDPRVKLA